MRGGQTSLLSRAKRWTARIGSSHEALQAVSDSLAQAEVARRKAEYANPLARRAGKVFSQTDEDGIIAEILRRIGLERGSYCEFGVGDGLECNTLALAARGWRGFWISGEPLAFPTDGLDGSFFRFDHAWVDLDNVVELYRRNAQAMKLDRIDVLSFDLDSRDLFFLEALLESGLQPELAVVEYNAKFAPPIRWSVAPGDPAPWQGTDYMGASLTSLADLFDRHGYRLVACNPATGANAFFVRKAHAGRFGDVPTEVDALFVTPFYQLPRYGHASDPRTVRRVLEIGSAIWRGESSPEHVPGGFPSTTVNQ